MRIVVGILDSGNGGLAADLRGQSLLGKPGLLPQITDLLAERHLPDGLPQVRNPVRPPPEVSVKKDPSCGTSPHSSVISVLAA